MPRINSIRIVNFRYDNDKKYIANETFEFGGKNALLNLENGGGKSVLLQLALQVLKPNAEMAGRKFVDYFKVNSGTVHILTEWILDSTVREYLLTGICASRDSEGLKFFTYTHAYTTPNECDLKHIMVVNSKKQVTGYSEYYKYLRQMSGNFRINTYSKDRMRDYAEKLASNSLFENEFEAVRVINQTEGGIEKFFERARKSRNVIERLIIPAIPSLAGQEQNLLSDTFRKHFDNLKSMPVLKSNISTYQGFLDRGADFLKLLEEYEKSVLGFSDFRGEVKILGNILLVAVKRLSEELLRFQEEYERLKEQKGELEFKQESLEIYIEKRNLKEAQEICESMSKQLENERLKLSEAVSRIRYMNSANKCIQIREQKKTQMNFKEKLRALSLKEGEVQKEHQECLNILSLLLEGEMGKLETKAAECLEEERRIRGCIDDIKCRVALMAGDKEKASNDLAVKKAQKERIESDYYKFSTRFNARDMSLLIEPSKSLEEFESKLSVLEKDKSELIEKIKSLTVMKEDARIKAANLASEKKTILERLSGKKEILEAYEKKLSNISSKLNAMGIEPDIYSVSAAEMLSVMAQKTGLELSYAQADHNAAENKRLLMDGLDYYVPDKDILKIYRYLEENGIACIPGGLWLKKQPEAMRRSLLYKNPLIPFSIIVEERKLQKVRELSSNMTKLANDYPVAFIADNDKGLVYEAEISEDSYLDRVNGSMVFLLRADSYRLFINEDEFFEFISGLGKLIHKKREEIEVLKDEHEKIISMKESIKSFAEEHSLIWRNSLMEEIEKLKRSISDIEEETAKIKRSSSEIENTLDTSNKRLSDTDNEIVETKTDISEMKEIIRLKEELFSCNESIEKLIPYLKNIEKDLQSLEDQKEKLDIRFRDEHDRARELSRHKDKLSQRLSQVKNQIINVVINIKEPHESIDELEARIEALKQKLNASEKEDLLSMIKSIEETNEQLVKTVHDNGHSENDFENVFEKIPESEINDAVENEKRIREVEKETSKEVKKSENESSKLSGSVNTRIQLLLKKYGRDCYEFNSGEPLDQAFYEKSIIELNTKMTRLQNKISDIAGRKSEVEKISDGLTGFIEDRKIEVPQGYERNMLELRDFGESVGIWDVANMKPSEIAVLSKKYRQEHDRLQDEVELKEKAVGKNFESLYQDESWKENGTIKRVLSGIMKENLYNYKSMKDLFSGLFESVSRMRDAAELQLEECRRNKDELVERCLQRAKAVYDEVRLVDTFSKIKVGSETIKIVKIEMPKLENEQGKVQMSIYLQKCVDELEKLKNDGGYDPARIETVIHGYMAPGALLDAVVNLNDISIKVFKPEHNLELSRYIPWEVVVLWSGGEKLAGFFAMFISIISYLRYKKTGWQGSTKVIWIDNPFGQANAGHILDYIFELAKATNTQMICLTGLQETNIYAQFEVVYSLVHRMLSSMSIIQSRQVKGAGGVEVGYYHVKGEQLSIFG